MDFDHKHVSCKYTHTPSCEAGKQTSVVPEIKCAPFELKNSTEMKTYVIFLCFLVNPRWRKED